MSNQVEVIDADKTSNQAAMHSVMVMEQWGNGEAYNEDVWIERAKLATRKTMEGMFELGQSLIVLKEHMTWKQFADVCEVLGMSIRAAQQLVQATQRFATPQMQKALPKLMDLGKSKLLELLVEEDVTLAGLAEGGEVNGMTLDDVDRMTVRELRVALRENREQLAAKDKVLGDKNAKIDELAEKLEKSKKKGTVKEPDPADVANELHMMVGTKEVAIRSQVVQLGELFGQMAAHETAHGLSHRAKMVGVINQIMMDLNHLREQFGLPNETPDSDIPEWLPENAIDAE